MALFKSSSVFGFSWNTLTFIEEVIGHRFEDVSKLVLCMNEGLSPEDRGIGSLSFLGRSVLNTIVADNTCRKIDVLSSHEIPEVQASYLRKTNMQATAELARAVALPRFLHHLQLTSKSSDGPSSAEFGEVLKEDRAARIMECLMGAVYLDSDMRESKDIYARCDKDEVGPEVRAQLDSWAARWRTAWSRSVGSSSATEALDRMFARGAVNKPSYQCNEIHRLFIAVVYLGEEARAIGCGRDIKEARDTAAQVVIEDLGAYDAMNVNLSGLPSASQTPSSQSLFSTAQRDIRDTMRSVEREKVTETVTVSGAFPTSSLWDDLKSDHRKSSSSESRFMATHTLTTHTTASAVSAVKVSNQSAASSLFNTPGPNAGSEFIGPSASPNKMLEKTKEAEREILLRRKNQPVKDFITPIRESEWGRRVQERVKERERQLTDSAGGSDRRGSSQYSVQVVDSSYVSPTNDAVNTSSYATPQSRLATASTDSASKRNMQDISLDRRIAIFFKDPALLNRLKETLFRLDHRSDGTLSAPEIHYALALLGLHLNDNELSSLMSRHDLNGNGRFHYYSLFRAIESRLMDRGGSESRFSSVSRENSPARTRESSSNEGAGSGSSSMLNPGLKSRTDSEMSLSPDIQKSARTDSIRRKLASRLADWRSLLGELDANGHGQLSLASLRKSITAAGVDVSEEDVAELFVGSAHGSQGYYYERFLNSLDTFDVESNLLFWESKLSSLSVGSQSKATHNPIGSSVESSLQTHQNHRAGSAPVASAGASSSIRGASASRINAEPTSRMNQSPKLSYRDLIGTPEERVMRFIDDLLFERRAAIRNAIVDVDKNGTGLIIAHELISILRRATVPLNDEKLRQLLGRFEPGRDSRIQWTEFLRVISELDPEPSSARGRHEAQQFTESERQTLSEVRRFIFDNHKRMGRLFEDMDVNRDGTVSNFEFKLGLESLGITVSEDDANLLVNRFDLRTDGRVHFVELVRLLAELLRDIDSR